MFWDRLDRPPGRGDTPDRQDRQGQSRCEWAQSCRMEKIKELGGELDIDMMHVHDKLCDQVHAKERAKMSQAVSQLVLGICDAASMGTSETVPVVVGCLTELAEKGIDPEDEESYYSDEEDDGEVNPTVAARGLGHVGNVPIAESLWSRFVLGDVRDRYRRWRQETHGVGKSDGVGVREMPDALVRDGALRKHENVREASGKAEVRPKNSEKCVFILNCVNQNACDDHKPRGFQLPQIERLRDSVLLGGSPPSLPLDSIYPLRRGTLNLTSGAMKTAAGPRVDRHMFCFACIALWKGV